MALPRVVAAFVDGGEQDQSGLGMIMALSLLEQDGDPISPIAFVRAGDSSKTSSTVCTSPCEGTLPVYYNPINLKSTMVATNDIGTEVATL